SFFPLYTKRAPEVFPGARSCGSAIQVRATGGATMRPAVSLRDRALALVALALLAFAADALPSAAAELPTDPKCEFIASPASSKCMLPFPDDYYTKADPTSPTTPRVDFPEPPIPKTARGTATESAPYH